MTKKQHLQIDGHELTLSNADKVYFPESGFTKGEVIAFYSSIADVIIPHLHSRPLTLKRYPDGVEGEPFYEKNAPSHKPDWVTTCAVPRSEGGEINYILCNDRATLVWATNLGDIEKHVLLARAPDLNRPTSVVFDLDPGEGAGLLDCAEIALELKKVLDALKLESFVKVSGSKGLHMAVPFNTAMTYEMAQPFAKTIAELMVQQMPDRVVSEMAKTLRRKKILIDWSQNSDFKTTVAVYAMRTKHGEPFISMPVTWEELTKAVKRGDEKPLFFTPAAAIKRIKKLGDLFAPVLKLRQKLPAQFVKALAVGPPRKLSRWPRKEGGSVKDKSLREYAAKRDHNQTPEPAAKPVLKKGSADGIHRFVIQKHEASHLHFDFRLEMQGVLRSWAVPKGPPTEPRESRLAMHVEDHPLEYANFEGTIPAGNYGAGTVMVWDQGEYGDITGNPAAAFHAGKMHIVMRGEKLNGEWILVKDRREEEGNRWLLIKAGTPLKLSAKQLNTSCVTGRTMAQIAKDNDKQWKSSKPAANSPRKRSFRHFHSHDEEDGSPPRFVEPMQCKPVKELPDEDGWTFEIKFDGYRCLAIKNGSKVDLWSRNEKRLNHRFPQIAEAVAALPGNFTIDGEAVALDANGKHSFQILQNNTATEAPILFYAFDLLNAGGEDLLAKPIEKRRELLAELVGSAADPLRLAPVLEAPPAKVLEAVKKLGLEGAIGKRDGSVYGPGERSGAWIKCRSDQSQEFVIGGYVPGSHGFDSLLIGVYEAKKFIYVGKVRNGFVPRIRDDVFPLIKKLQQAKCPFANLPEERSSRWGESLSAEKMADCRWVKPKLVCQVAFLEWTNADHLRHCSFLGMRDDKKAATVVRET